MIFIIILPALICLILAYMLYRQKRSFESSVDYLTEYLMKVQDRDAFPQIRNEDEGKMKVLASEIYKVSASLHEQYALEQQKNRYLEDMLSNIAHQFRTPLTAVTIMTDALKSGTLGESERRRCLHRITQETDHLSWLCETLLTIARLDAGTLILKKEDTDLKGVITDITDSLAVSAEIRDTELKADIPKGSVIKCDREWTGEALLNIIKNCLEHTDSGTVSITSKDSNLFLDIRIEDTGTGISAEDLPRLFDRFYSGRNALSTSVGIGLALSKQIITMQNGTVSVESEEGKGTVFTVRFYKNETI